MSLAASKHVNALPGDLIIFKYLGLQIRAGFNEDDNDRPFVSIDTSEMRPCDTYDETTGLRGDAEPFTVEEKFGWSVVKTWGDQSEIVASFPQTIEGRLDAKAYAKTRNATWSESCGSPIIAVHINDGAAIYEDDGSGNTAHLTEQVVEKLRRMVQRAFESGTSAELSDAIEAMRDELDRLSGVAS